MSDLLDLEGAAEVLGLPEQWLRAELDAGRIPHLDAGGVIRVNPVIVAEALASRATETRKPWRDAE